MEILTGKSNNVSIDLHTEPHYDVTPGQMTFFLIWIGCSIVWIIQYIGLVNFGTSNSVNSDPDPSPTSDTTKSHQTTTDSVKPHISVNDSISDIKSLEEGKVTNNGNGGQVDVKQTGSDVTQSNGAKAFTTFRPPPTLHEFLLKVMLFGLLLVYFYLCDYRKIFPKTERVYDRDQFLFIVFLLFLVASAFTIKPNTDKILNRDQTEEWKGWMQVMFVWYHVFAAKEWYNWIRVYIAAYVWMTGFGNFSFFWIKKDFSVWRFLKMQFRLNFLVTCLCVVTNNEYMLYYICAMHSYWFVSVYVFMGTLNSWNTHPKKMAVKFGAYFLFNLLIFEVNVIRDNIFRPLLFILQYHSPNFDTMHEWVFRAGLDHWACFVGMLCAYNYPHFETFIKKVEQSENIFRKLVTKVVMVAVCSLTLFIWYFSCMQEDKFSYNRIHPYTSFVPIICFIIIRNSFPVLRQYHVTMFAWLGKITLETYLSQLHVYLQSNAKDFIRYLPEGYPLLNFAFATIIYLLISHCLFDLTTDLSAYLIPKSMRLVCKNVLVIVSLFVVICTIISLRPLLIS